MTPLRPAGYAGQMYRHLPIVLLCVLFSACSFVQEKTQQVKDTGSNVLHAVSGAIKETVTTGKEVFDVVKKKAGDVADGVGKIKEGIDQVRAAGSSETK